MFGVGHNGLSWVESALVPALKQMDFTLHTCRELVKGVNGLWITATGHDSTYYTASQLDMKLQVSSGSLPCLAPKKQIWHHKAVQFLGHIQNSIPVLSLIGWIPQERKHGIQGLMTDRKVWVEELSRSEKWHRRIIFSPTTSSVHLFLLSNNFFCVNIVPREKEKAFRESY